MLCSELTQHLQSYFNDIKDPRVRTQLTDILMISILAVMAGAARVGRQTYGLSKQAWEEFLALPNGIPCADTFRVFERIDPKAFEQCFQRWVGTLVERLGAQVIPIKP